MDEVKVFAWLNKMVENTRAYSVLANSIDDEYDIRANDYDYVHLFGDHETLLKVADIIDKPVMNRDLDDHWEHSFAWKGMKFLWLTMKPVEMPAEETAEEETADEAD